MSAATQRNSEVVLLAASDVLGLLKWIDALAATSEHTRDAELGAAAAALARAPAEGRLRLAVVTRSPDRLRTSLLRAANHLRRRSEIDDANDPDAGVFAGRALERPSCVALFPGEGSARRGMGAHLLERYRFVRCLYEEAQRATRDVVGGDWCDALSAPADVAAAGSDRMAANPAIAQPAVALSSLASLAVLRSFGLEPDWSIGHGLGEIAALHAGGAFGPATAVRIAALRGRILATERCARRQAAVVVGAAPEEVAKLIDRSQAGLVISSFDSSRQTVVNGDAEAVADLAQLCEREHIRHEQCEGAAAPHSPSASAAARAFAAALCDVTPKNLTGCPISTSTGHLVPPDADLRELLSEHVARPVRFLDAVLEVARSRPTLWVEIGPGQVLTRHVRDILGDDAVACMPTDPGGADGFDSLSRLAAKAFTLGFPIQPDRLFEDRTPHRPSVASHGPQLVEPGAASRPFVTPPTSLSRAASELAALLPGIAHALGVAEDPELVAALPRGEISAEDLRRAAAVDPSRREQTRPRGRQGRARRQLLDLVAARRAAVAFARRHRGLALIPTAVTLERRADGRAQLAFESPEAGRAFEGVSVSLSNCNGVSVALLGPAPLAVALQRECGGDEPTWHTLLGSDATALARAVAFEAGEWFSDSATRVLGLMVAEQKAGGGGALPRYAAAHGGGWLSFSGAPDDTKQRLLSATLDRVGRSGPGGALTVTLCAPAPVRSHERRVGAGRAADELFPIVEELAHALDALRSRCADDPDAAGTEGRHAGFARALEAFLAQLAVLEGRVDPVELPALRTAVQRQLLAFLDGSEVFRHALVKPLGYAWDFRLVEKLARSECANGGLAYHFDRYLLEQPWSRSCRMRAVQVHRSILRRAERAKTRTMRLLDLGCGCVPIERRLLQTHPELSFELVAVDLEPQALEWVERTVGGRRPVRTRRLDLREPDCDALRVLARGVDVCIATGVLETLTEPAADRLLATLLRALPAGATLFADTAVPSERTRRFTEWLLDAPFACRTADGLEAMALRAGAAPERLHVRRDALASWAALEVTA